MGFFNQPYYISAFCATPGYRLFTAMSEEIESWTSSQTRLAEIISMHFGIPWGVTARQRDSGLSSGDPSPSGTVLAFQQPPEAQQSSWPMVWRK